jgi:hypothetical protein
MNQATRQARSGRSQDALALAIAKLSGEISRLRMALDSAPPPVPAKLRTGRFFERYHAWFAKTRRSALRIG